MVGHPARTASFIITFLAATSNLAIALQVLAAWRALNSGDALNWFGSHWNNWSEWELEGSWSGSDKWRIEGVQLIWGLLVSYFGAAAAVSALGCVGIVKRKPSFVKFYRDYSIADFSFCTLLTLLIAYAAAQPQLPLGVCEGLAQQPELMRDMAELGMSAENCERWFKRASLAFLAVMLVVLVARIHFLLAVGIYYSHLSKTHVERTPVVHNHLHNNSDGPQMTHAHHTHTHSRSSNRSSSTPMQRVFLLPQAIPGVSSLPLLSRNGSGPNTNQGSHNHRDEGAVDEIVYAPLPMSALPREMAMDLRRNAKESWVVSGGVSASASSSTHVHRHRHHHHHHSHSHSHSRSHGQSTPTTPISPVTPTTPLAPLSLGGMNGSGQISLPIRPDEGLLPAYSPTFSGSAGFGSRMDVESKV